MSSPTPDASVSGPSRSFRGLRLFAYAAVALLVAAWIAFGARALLARGARFSTGAWRASSPGERARMAGAAAAFLEREQASASEVLRLLGPPRARWSRPGGGEVLAYSLGAVRGTELHVEFGAGGRIERARVVRPGE